MVLVALATVDEEDCFGPGLMDLAAEMLAPDVHFHSKMRHLGQLKGSSTDQL